MTHHTITKVAAMTVSMMLFSAGIAKAQSYCLGKNPGGTQQINVEVSVNVSSQKATWSFPTGSQDIDVETICDGSSSNTGSRNTQIRFSFANGTPNNCRFVKDHGGVANRPIWVQAIPMTPPVRPPYENPQRVIRNNNTVEGGRGMLLTINNRNAVTGSGPNERIEEYLFDFAIQCGGTNINVDPRIRNRSR